ncbi:hypothetical protein ABW21_db0208340 [Orbilia brochopaga]|nr:hypothetical protein ABW21_db0208340 [Drechslerella brochopaga]
MPPQRYVALSHCWGTYRLPFKVTKAFLETSNAIRISDLSKSFQDAMAVTRRLGMRHLWIDSLCILQDDRDDWLIEFAQMHTVYSQAALTISITGAGDGRIGCFGGRTPREHVSVPYTHSGTSTSGEVFAFALTALKESRPDKYIEMEDEPVSERAWCFQERVLSRRVLHFAREQMYFECNDGIRSEDGLHRTTRYFTLHGRPESCFLPGSKGMGGGDSDLNLWWNILWSYGPRKLTDPTDKLPAFAGVAAVFAERMNDEYIAGLWRKSLIEGLNWQGLGITDEDVGEPREPSWSWAAINGIPATGLTWRWEPLAHIFEVMVEREGESQFGRVKKGTIKMNAPLVPLTLAEADRQGDDLGDGLPKSPMHLRFGTPAGQQAGCFGRFDCAGQKQEDTLALAREGLVSALVLAVTVGDTERARVIPNYFSILVTPVEREDEDGRTFRRVGWANLPTEEVGVDEVRTSRTAITLV